MQKYNYLACCILAATMHTLPVQAEETQPCDDTQKTCEQPIITLDTVTVTATRTETDTAKYAGQIGILTKDDLAPSANVVDALATIPGVYIGSDMGRNIGSQYSIRGFGYGSESRVIIRQNGVPQSPSLFSNQISSFRTDSDLLKRVEVVKGASSILYGSGAIGGIIDMHTMNAKDKLNDGEQFGAFVGGRAESNNMHSVRGGIYGQAKSIPVDFMLYSKKASYGDVELAGNGSANYQETENDEDIQTSYLNVGWDINDEQHIRFSLFDFDEDVLAAWQSLYHPNIPVVGEEARYTGSLTQTDYTLDYGYKSSSNTLLDLSIKAYSTEADYTRDWDYVDDNKERRVGYYSTNEERWGVNVKNVATFNTGTIQHILLTGAEFKHREENAVATENGSYDDYGFLPNDYDDWGFYIQDIMEIGKLELTLAGRYDMFDRSVNKPNKPKYDDNNFSPRVAVSYELIDGLNLLLGYSESFRAPTPKETSSQGALNPFYYYLSNPNLRAETAKEWEGGFAFDRTNLFQANDQLSIKATYFDGNIEDMITLERLPEMGKPPESRMYAQYQNVADAKRRGFEVSANYLMDQWMFNTSYEHLDIYNKETKVKLPAGGYADKLQLSATWFNHDAGLQLGLNMEYWFEPDQNPKTVTSRGKVYTYVDQEFKQFNLKGSWDIPFNVSPTIDGLTLKFGVNNLTNKQYINARDVNETSRVGVGTNAYIDIELDF